MKKAISQLSFRVKANNENHHLWNNHGTWFVHFTVHHQDSTKERFRQSLKTKSLEKARRRRDALFDRLQTGFDDVLNFFPARRAA